MHDPPLEDAALSLLIRTIPGAHAAHLSTHSSRPTITVLLLPGTRIETDTFPLRRFGRDIIYREAQPFNILHCPQDFLPPQARTQCFNEPVPGGCQIQPAGANWVGTLGCACSYHNAAGQLRWGLLSNWHVLKMDVTTPQCPICQPLDAQPAIAHNDRYREVTPTGLNYFDAALADAKISGLHTIGPQLYELGRMCANPSQPTVGLSVCKSGRTSAVTCGIIAACGVTVSVDYGDFIASLSNQCLIESTGSAFSAPGDSGSLIVTEGNLCPVGLLFAGNDTLTVMCPIGPIVEAFGIGFDFP